MDPAYYVAAGSLKARSIQLDGLANNLANVSTVGFKAERTFFSVFNKAKADGGQLPLTPHVNDGTVLANRGTDFSQGPLRQTANAFDLAVEGDGFFAIRTPGGDRLTRDGRFTLAKDGQVVTHTGEPLLGKNGQPIQIDPAQGEVKISPDGSVYQGGTVISQVDIRNVQNPQMMAREAGNRFNPAGTTAAPSTGKVAQGYLEQSGVDMASAMVEMIRLNRLYEMSMKVASTLANDLDARSITDIAMQR